MNVNQTCFSHRVGSYWASPFGGVHIESVLKFKKTRLALRIEQKRYLMDQAQEEGEGEGCVSVCPNTYN